MKFPFQIIAANDFDAVGFGTNAVDYLIQVPAYPAFNSKVKLSGYSQAAGGEVASTMAGLTRLGLKTSYIGRFGGDQAGKLGLQSLIDEGVDVTCVESVEKAQTQVAFIIVDERNGERTILWQRDNLLAYCVADAPLDMATRGRVLHLTPHDTQACIEMVRMARSRGVIVSIDLDDAFPDIEDLLPLVDVCIASSEFSTKLLGITDNRAALREFKSRYGCPVLGVTLGASGSLFLCQDTFIDTSGFNVPGGCVDTTGAGDAFRTGFLYGMLSGKTVGESARTANAVAALKCRRLGARHGLPDVKTLQTMLK